LPPPGEDGRQSPPRAGTLAPFARLAGGADRSGGGDGLLTVLLHGFGAPGDDLAQLWRQVCVPESARFAFPEAPLELDPGCRAWWHIDLGRLQTAIAAGKVQDLTGSLPAGLPEARGLVRRMLDELQHSLGISSDRILLGGFSQGAMLACDLALRDPRPLAGLALMSGTLLAESEWIPLMSRRAGLPVLQSHGREDPLLPFSIAAELHTALVAAGLEVSWIAFNGGHTISAAVLDGLGRFITRLSQAAC
jgi:phospholipase/carboxylesterase